MNFYKGNPDSINFTDIWTSNATYLDKVKVSCFSLLELLVIPLAKPFLKHNITSCFKGVLHNSRLRSPNYVD